MIDLKSNPPKRSQFAANDVEGVESHPFCTTLDLQLSFYRPLCYNSRAYCTLMQNLCTTSAILAGAHSYFVVSSFKCEGENSCHGLIPKPSIFFMHLGFTKEPQALIIGL